jgi:hypothetical protein
MRSCFQFFMELAVFTTATASAQPVPAPDDSGRGVSGGAADTLRSIFNEALTRGQAFENLRALVTRYPGRLSG